MQECMRKSECWHYGRADRNTCNVCKDETFFEPVEIPKTTEGLLDYAIANGATHFELFDISLDEDDCGPDWHWDIFKGNPHKWFGIIKPWTIRLWWRGFKGHDGKFQWPVGEYHSHWLFTYYKGAEAMGCQMAMGPGINLQRGLAHAVSHFMCDCSESKYCDEYEDCKGCPFDSLGFN